MNATDQSNVVPLFDQNAQMGHGDLLNLARANMLYAAADFCRTAINAEDRTAVKLAQTIIVQIRSFGEETVHDGLPDP